MYNPMAYKRKLKVFHNAQFCPVSPRSDFLFAAVCQSDPHKIILSEEERPLEGIEERMKEDEKGKRKKPVITASGRGSWTVG